MSNFTPLDVSIIANVQAAVGSTLAIPEALELTVPDARSEFERRTAKGDHTDLESLIITALRDLWTTAHKQGVRQENFREYCREQLAQKGDSLLGRVLNRKRQAQAALEEAQSLEQQALDARNQLSLALQKKEKLEHELALLQKQTGFHTDDEVEKSLRFAASLHLVRDRTVKERCQYREALRHAVYSELTGRVIQYAIEDKQKAIAANDAVIAELKRAVKSIGK